MTIESHFIPDQSRVTTPRCVLSLFCCPPPLGRFSPLCRCMTDSPAVQSVANTRDKPFALLSGPLRKRAGPPDEDAPCVVGRRGPRRDADGLAQSSNACSPCIIPRTALSPPIPIHWRLEPGNEPAVAPSTTAIDLGPANDCAALLTLTNTPSSHQGSPAISRRRRSEPEPWPWHRHCADKPVKPMLSYHSFINLSGCRRGQEAKRHREG